ncbi:polysaccharide biosynthesis/export family protein [Methyloceanibacter sp.]|uniref:polysaccharide biosynthesis/export family protein n=1 Tax=Methyloceanibacter sp. TaxID=1965321 RepID=UPI003D6C7D3D
MALFLAVGIVSLVTLDGSVNAAEGAAGSAQSAPAGANDALGDYHLAPGDRLTIVVFDESQLSGDFYVDGGGEVLLPLAGSVRISGLTLPEAQELIQRKFAEGVLVKPAVSVRIKQYRPIFVTGDVKRPGSYRFMFGESVKAAIATAGGEGAATEKPVSLAVSDYVTAEERVRQLEADHVSLLVRKARLEAQRDERDNFVMPLLVGFNPSNVEFERVYSAETDAFSRLSQTYHDQLESLQKQRPRIEAEIKAVSEQISTQNERLEIVNGRLADLEPLFHKGFLRKEVLINQQIDKTLVQSQLSNLQAQVAHLRQTMGDLDVRLGDVKANYTRQVLGELQETVQRLRGIETTLGPARKLRAVKAEEASGANGEAEYAVFISRVQDGRMVNFEATGETTLSPGDVVEVKLKRHDPGSFESPSTEAARDMGPSPASLAEESASPAR